MRTLLLSCALFLAFASCCGARLLTADMVNEPQNLLPYFSWLPDPEGRQSIDNVGSGSLQERFAPLSGGIPLKGTGPVWIRLVMIKAAPVAQAPANADRQRLVMSLGQLPPGGARIFYAEGGADGASGSWRAEDLVSHERVLLPEPGLIPVSVYIRLAEMPGLWFSPTVSSQNAVQPDMLPSELILPGLLIAAAAVCLLRALAERAAWALWSALFLGCVLVHAALPLPLIGRGMVLADLPALLAPGLALILLPHVGRCMLRTDKSSRFQDGLLYACSLAGLGLALAPLVPGLGWLTRLFPLWPLLLAPLLPLCVSSLAARKPGALAFAGACFMPVLGAALALYALQAAFAHPLAAQGSLWGLAVGGIALALARIPKTAPAAEEAHQAGLTLAESAAEDAKANGASKLAGPPAFSPEGQYAQIPSLQVEALSPYQEQSAFTGEAAPMYAGEHEPASQENGANAPAGQPEWAAAPGHDAAPMPEQEPARPAAHLPPEDDSLKYIHDPALSFEPSREPGTPEAPGQIVIAQEDDDGPPVVMTRIEPFASPNEHAAPAGADAPALTAASPAAYAGYAPDAPEQHAFVYGPSGMGETLAVGAPLTSAEDEVLREPEHGPATDFLAGREQPPAPEALPKQDAPHGAQDAEPHESYGVDEQEPAPELAAPELATLVPDFAASSSADEIPSDGGARVISLVDEDFSDYMPDPAALMALESALGMPFDLLEGEEGLRLRASALTPGGSYVFSLHSLVREVHDIVAPLAKARSLIFSWYIAPTLPALLEGDAPRLRGALSLLLQNAVQATRQGAVQLTVRKNPGSDEAGDLLFSISDNGSAQRTDAGFFHAWELAARSGGAFTVDYSPSGGTQISFTVRFSLPSEEAARQHLARALPGEAYAGEAYTGEAPENDDEPMPVLHTIRELTRKALPDTGFEQGFVDEEPWLAAMSPEQVLAEQGFLEPLAAPSSAAAGHENAAAPRPDASQGHAGRADGVPRLVAAEMTTSNRRLLAGYLSDLPHEHIDAASNDEVLSLFRERPLSLIIFDADMPEPDIIRTIGTLRKEEAGGGTTPILVLTSHTAQSARMLEAGASYALCKPYPRQALRDMVALAVPGLAPFAARKEPGETRAAERDDAPAENGMPQVASGHAMPDPGMAFIRLDGSSRAPAAPLSGELAPAWTEGVEAEAAPYIDRDIASYAAPPSGPAGEKDTDLLAEALRDAPAPADTAPVIVSLPPRHGISEFPEPALERTGAELSESLSPARPAGQEPQESAPPDAERQTPPLPLPKKQVMMQLTPRQPKSDLPTPGRVMPPRLRATYESGMVASTPEAASGAEYPPALRARDEKAPEAAAREQRPQNEREVDILAAALRDAPLQSQGAPVMVQLPPRYGFETQTAPMTPGIERQAQTAPEPPRIEISSGAPDLPDSTDAPDTDDQAEDALAVALREAETPTPVAHAQGAPAPVAPAPVAPAPVAPAPVAPAPVAPAPVAPAPETMRVTAQPPAATQTSKFTVVSIDASAPKTLPAPAPADADAEGRAAPMILGLSPEDVRPAEAPARSAPPAEEEQPAQAQHAAQAERAPEQAPEPEQPAPVRPDASAHDVGAGAGSLLDFVLPDELIPENAEADEAHRPQADETVPPLFDAEAPEAAYHAAPVPERHESRAPALPELFLSTHYEAPDAVVEEATPDAVPGVKAAPVFGQNEPGPMVPQQEFAAVPHVPAQGEAPQWIPEGDEHGEADSSGNELSDFHDAPADTGSAADDEFADDEFADDDSSGDARAAQAVPGKDTFPLPGIAGEAIDPISLPLVPGIVQALNDALRDILKGRAEGKTILVQEAASRLASRAEHFDLLKLGKIARCVERAAEADDMEAVNTLLDDLEPVTNRYIASLQECFQSFLSFER